MLSGLQNRKVGSLTSLTGQHNQEKSLLSLQTGIKFFLFLVLIFINSCTKVYDGVKNPEREIFNFMITEAQRQYINTSRGKTFDVTNPVPGLNFAGSSYTLDRFDIRGESSLNFERKGFGVNMGRKITFLNPDEQTERKYDEFKLLAMVFDYTYIENSTAVGLFKEVHMWPVYSFFTEVKLNNHTQGLYHFIEDPVEYFIEQQNSSLVLRRGYDHSLKAYKASPSPRHDPQTYISRFNKIYSDIALYSGSQLYDTISASMDMEQYFTKLSIDMLIKNGDYTDEIFFYTKTRNDKEIFGVFPWDYDDLFSAQPHEIGRSWAIGTVFGHRLYNSMNDIIADVGSKLLFSIEDDLDYKIAKDSFLYQLYLKTLRSVVEKTDISIIDKIFDSTFDRISPFYANDSIVAQSKYDADETNYDLFVANLAEKRQFLKDRRSWILQELGIQQNK
jgi:spore coat protein H